MKTLAFIKDLPYSKPTISYNHYETTILDRSNFPDFVKEELQLDTDSVLTLETVKGQTPTHTDSPPRQAHIVWYISDVPMTLVTEYGTSVLNYGDSMVINSQSKHKGIVENGGNGTFFAVDYGKNYEETLKIYEKYQKNW